MSYPVYKAVYLGTLPKLMRIACNPVLEELTKYSRDELIGANAVNFYEISEEQLKKELKDLAKKGYAEVETNCLRKDGEKVPVVINVSVMKDKKGEPIGHICAVTDITELKKSEEEIRAAKAYIEAIINNQPIGLMIYRADDPKRKWRVVNSALEKITGYSAEEMVGKSVEEMDFNTDEAMKVIRESRKKFERKDYTGVTVYEFPWVHKSGEPIIVRVRTAKIGDDYVDTIEDVTELREREEELKKSQEYTRSLFHSIPNPTLILDLDGRRIDTTKATEDLFRMPRDEILGSKVEDLYAKEDLRKIREAMERGKEGYSSCETTCIRGDGTGFPAVLSFAPVRDKDGNLINIVFSATDVTELKNKESNLKSAISSFGGVLSKAASGDLTQKVDISKISEEYRPIGGSINKMISAIEKNIAELQKRETELRESRQLYYELVEGVNSIVLRMDGEGTITFINRFAEELFGYTRHEIIGRDIVGTLVPEIESTGRDLKEMILDIGINPEKYKINVNENMRKNGERIWVSWTNKPIFDEQGHVVEVMCIGNDITELKKHEEKLKRLIKRYEEYIGPVAKTIAKGILEE